MSSHPGLSPLTFKVKYNLGRKLKLFIPHLHRISPTSSSYRIILIHYNLGLIFVILNIIPICNRNWTRRVNCWDLWTHCFRSPVGKETRAEPHNNHLVLLNSVEHFSVFLLIVLVLDSLSSTHFPDVACSCFRQKTMMITLYTTCPAQI